MPVASVVDKGSHRLSCEWIGLGLAVLTVVATFVAGGFSFFGYSPGAYVLLLGGSFGCWWLWRFAEQRVKESVIKLLVAYGIFVTWLATVKEPAYPAKRVVSIEPDSTCFAALRARDMGATKVSSWRILPWETGPVSGHSSWRRTDRPTTR